MMLQRSLSDFDQMVDAHTREIFTYLWRMLRDPQDAEDALQETFLRAFRGFPRLEVDSNLRAWLYKIATNVAYTHLKKRNRQQSRTADLDEAALPASQPATEQTQTLEELRAAVESLPRKQRAALLLRHYQGFEYPEIAEILQCSEDSARANAYQAVKKLRSLFAEEEI